MTFTRTAAVLLTALALTAGAAAALPGQAAPDATDAQHSGNESAADAAAPMTADQAQDRAGTAGPPEEAAGAADAATGDRGPPVDMPDQVPDFVSDIHQAVQDKLDGSLDGSLGDVVSDLTPDGESEEAAEDGDETAGAGDEETDDEESADDGVESTEDEASTDTDTETNG
jgi:hypothetical protein